MDSTITPLPNGATFIFAEHPSPAYAVRPVMQTGHLDWFDRRPGLAHFVEHMLFEGSPVLAPGELSFGYAKRYHQTSNGETDLDKTTLFSSRSNCYWFKAEELVSGLVPVIANAFAMPFDLATIEQERRRIISEIKGDIDQRELLGDKKVKQRAYFAALYRQPVYNTVKAIGGIEDNEATTRDELAAFHAEHYCGRRLVIVCSGPSYPHDLVTALAENLQNITPGQPAPLRAYSGFPAEGQHTPEHPQENKLELTLSVGCQWGVRPGLIHIGQLAIDYLQAFWEKYIHEEKGAYSAGVSRFTNAMFSEFIIEFPYTNKAAALALGQRFLGHVAAAAAQPDLALFSEKQHRQIDRLERIETPGNELVKWNYATFVDCGQPTSIAAEKAKWAAVTPADLQNMFRRILDAPLGVYTTGAVGQHLGLEDMERLFAPYRSGSPTAGQAIIPTVPARPAENGPAAKAAGPHIT